MNIIEGKYIGAGQKNLFVKILGEGTPAVVIEPDWGGLSCEWQDIQNELSKLTTVITYDRAGYGESPRGEQPRDGRHIASELYTMLSNTNIREPYIFIGHSGGGLYVQLYAKMFPMDVAGIILVDSLTADNDEFDKLDAPTYQSTVSFPARMENIRKFLEIDKDEFSQQILPMLQNLYNGMNEDIKHQLITYQSEKGFYQTLIDEYDASLDTYRQLKEIKMLPNFPLKVLCRDYKVMLDISKQIGIPEDEARAVEELWLKQSKNLLNLSTDSEFYLVSDSSHSIHQTRPDAVIQAVVDMVKKVRGN
jgi:pimeloyl-ACP methyl ester carboxylesterase